MYIASAKTFGNKAYATEDTVSTAVEQHVSSAIHVPNGGTSGYFLKNNGNGSVAWNALPTIPDSLQALDSDAYNKLNGIASGAQVNQNAYKTIAVKANSTATATNVSATTATDTLTLIGGGNISFTANATNRTITISATDTTYNAATTTADGLMTSTMVSKLSGIANGATSVTSATVGSWGYTKVTSATVNGWGYTKVDSATVNGWGYTKLTNANVSTIASAIVSSSVTKALRYKDTVSSYSNLPTTGQEIGDIYNILNADPTHNIKAGENVAWNGSAWDPLGGTVDLSNYPTSSTVSAMISSAAVTIDSTLTSTGTNPVQGKVVYSALAGKVDSVSGKGLSTEDFTTDFKTKLTSIASGAQPNQNAYKTVAVKASAAATTSTAVNANVAEATLTFIAGSNITLTGNNTSRTITIDATDTTYAAATTTADGLMTSTMVSKLSGITAGAQPNQSAYKTVGVKNGSTSTSVVANSTEATVTFVAGSNITLAADNTSKTVTISAKDTTYGTATTTSDGLMGSAMVTKLNGITSGAQPNQNAYKTVTVKASAAATTSTAIAAGAAEDTLTFIAGDNVTLTGNATSKTITISTTDTTYGAATTAADGLMTSTMVSKLNGISAGAQANQNAYQKVAVKASAAATTSTTITAGNTADTVTFIGGDNVTLTANATNKTVTISAKDTTYGAATSTADGLMTSAMVSKLATIAESATKVTSATVGSWGYTKVTSATVDSWGYTKVTSATVGTTWGYTKVTSANVSTIASTIASSIVGNAEANQNAYQTIAVKTSSGATASNVTASTTTDTVTLVGGSNVTLAASGKEITINAKDTTYGAATTTADGLMTSAMVTKLNGIATGATNVTSATVGTTWGYTKVTSANVSTIASTIASSIASSVVGNAEANQNAYQTIAVKTSSGATASNVTASTTTDTVTLIGGSNVTLAVSGKNITFNAKDTTYGAATTTADGLMTSAMVAKLNTIAESATKVTSATVGTTWGYTKLTNANVSTIVSGITYTKTEIDSTLSGYATTSAASTTANGLMTSTMVSKLNGIAEGATKVTSATVGTTWGYTKLTNANVSTIVSNIAYTKAQVDSAVSSAVASKVEYDDIAQVGFTGDYNDLVNKPSIPTGSALLPPSQKIQFTSANGTNATWSSNDLTITHTVDCIPNVIVYDNNWELTAPSVKYLTNSTVKLMFEDKSVVSGTWTCIVVYGFRG